MLRSERSERGQVVVLFVVVFSIFLLLAGFAVDQGYWYGRRRISQKDVDVAARSGALAYIGDRSDESGAAAEAEQTALDNGVTGTITTIAGQTCTGTDQDGRPLVITAPSIEVRLETEARRFFTRLRLVSDETAPIQLGASAVACVGRVSRLDVANGDDASDDNTLKGIPIALRSNAGGPRSCFSGGVLRLGFECAIYGIMDGPANRRMLFTDPARNECDGGGWNGIQSEIRDMEDGITFTCTVNTTNSCSSTIRRTSCISTENINREENQRRVFDAMERRLRNADNASDCASIEGGEPEQSFQNAFGNGDGDSGLAPDPPPLGGSGAPGHVYVQNDCFGNPRIAVLPIVNGGSDDLSDRPVRGFATIYITGCYHQDDAGSASARERNDCDENWNARNCDGPGNSPRDHCYWEIRAIPVHLFITSGALGGISSPSSNGPLTIQTVN